MNRVLVLCYHAVSFEWPAALSVTPSSLHSQVSWLLERGWKPARFTEAVVDPPKGKTFVVTFDDAYRSLRELAVPVLDDLGVVATIFVPTAFPGRRMIWPGIEHWADTKHADELLALSWDDLRWFHQRGWEVGAHSSSHPRLTRLDDATLRDEVASPRHVCEDQLQTACRSFAYPFGDADDRVRRAVMDAGYEAAAALSGSSFATRDPHDWPRVGVWHEDPDWRYKLKVTPITSDVRSLVARFEQCRQRIRGRWSRRDSATGEEA